MATHVRVLGTLHIVLGALVLIGGLALLLLLGGLAAFVGAVDHTEGKFVAVPVLGGIGGIIFLIALILSLPGLIAGFGLLQFSNWARILTIILSVLHLLNVPFGTALGFYGLWVLLSREGEQLFLRPPVQPARI